MKNIKQLIIASMLVLGIGFVATPAYAVIHYVIGALAAPAE